jgi:hypothetical protein
MSDESKPNDKPNDKPNVRPGFLSPHENKPDWDECQHWQAEDRNITQLIFLCDDLKRRARNYTADPAWHSLHSQLLEAEIDLESRLEDSLSAVDEMRLRKIKLFLNHPVEPSDKQLLNFIIKWYNEKNPNVTMTRENIMQALNRENY